MLKEILNPKACAECRLCCVFDRYDVWETPVFTEEIKAELLKLRPDTEFIEKDGGYLYKVRELDKDDLFRCPALSETGCILGDGKPFDCQIWPYRIMEIGGRRAVTIAPNCEEMFNKPLSEHLRFIRKGLAKEIFDYANLHPETVKHYNDMFPILLFDRKNGI